MNAVTAAMVSAFPPRAKEFAHSLNIGARNSRSEPVFDRLAVRRTGAGGNRVYSAMLFYFCEHVEFLLGFFGLM